MEFIYKIIIAVLIVYFFVDRFFLRKYGGNDAAILVNQNEKLPYRVKDNFLSDTERSFYHVLKLCVGDRAVVCPKVGLKDIFFIGKGVGKDYMKNWGKIAQKHVDFILCEPGTMKLLCGIELDDFSHTSKKSYERDLFVEKVYRDANFELIRMSSKSGYTQTEIECALNGVFDKPKEISVIKSSTENLLCPKCNAPMILRKATKGQNAGKEFYGCPNYPQCKEIISKEA